MARESSWVDVVRDRSDRHGRKRAFVYLEDGERDGPCITFRELEERARRRGSGLRRWATPGSRVVLVFAPGLDFIIAFHACLFAGLVPVPTFPPDSRRTSRSLERLRSIVSHSLPTFVLGHDAFAQELLPVLQEHRVPWHAWSEVSMDDDLEPYPARPEDLALLQYTSGSTGRPRGVMITHHNLLHNSRFIHTVERNDPSHVSVSWLPSHHDMGLIEGLLQPIYGGFSCYFMSPEAFLEHPRRWLQAISRFRATHSGAPNFAFDLCCKRISPEIIDTLDLSCLRLCYNGSEPIRPETLDRFLATFQRCGFLPEHLYPVYGLAEATLLVAAKGPSGHPACLELDGHRRVSVGRPETPENLAIIDPESGRPTQDQAVGEIWLRSPSVAAGYFRDEEETSTTFKALTADGQGPYLRTGDLGCIRDGNLYVVGRTKDLIIIRGENHYPQDLEWTVESAHPEIRTGCVAAVSIEQAGGEALAIALELKTRTQDLERDVSAALRAAISLRHGLDLAEIRFLEKGTLPKTSSGKIRRSVVKRFFSPVPNLALEPGNRTSSPLAATPLPTPVRPRSTLELPKPWQRAARAFALEILKTQCTGPLDLSMAPEELGLSSLQLTSLRGELEDAFHRRFDAARLIDAETVEAGLYAMLMAADEVSQGSKRPTTDRASLNETAAWAWQNLHPASDALEVQVQLLTERSVDQDRLAAAYERVRARHEMLRTCFEIKEHRLYRRETSASVPDLGRKSFDLASRPPLILRVLDDRTIELRLHHIGFDLDAVGTFLKELDTFYVDPDAELPIYPQPGEWAARQARTATEQERWTNLLLRPARPLLFPLDTPEAEEPSSISEALIRARAQRLGVTPFSVVLAAVAGAFAQHGNHEGFWLGVSTSGREPHFRNTIATFTHLVPVHIPRGAQNLDFDTLVQSCAASMVESLGRHTTPIRPMTEHIPAALRTWVLDAVVHYRHQPSPISSAWTASLHVPSQVNIFGQNAKTRVSLGRDTQAPFELDVSPVDGQLSCHARGSSPGRSRLLRSAIELLERDQGGPLLGRIAHPALTSKEPSPAGLDLVTTLLTHAKTERVALSSPSQDYTYAQLVAGSQRFAQILRAQGCSAGTVVAMYCEPTPECALALLGVWLTGAAACMLSTHAPEDVTRATLRSLQPWMCLRQTTLKSRFPSDASIPVIDLPSSLDPADEQDGTPGALHPTLRRSSSTPQRPVESFER